MTRYRTIDLEAIYFSLTSKNIEDWGWNWGGESRNFGVQAIEVLEGKDHSIESNGKPTNVDFTKVEASIPV
jgi:hypothetical protein